MGEFEGVGEQVLDDLLQALGIGEHGARQLRGELDFETDILRFRHMLEGARDIAVQVVEAQLAAFHHHRAGFDF